MVGVEKVQGISHRIALAVYLLQYHGISLARDVFEQDYRRDTMPGTERMTIENLTH